MERITASFFERHPVVCARELVGCVFEWHGCAGRIVETEAYTAEGDAACHTFFRPGARRFVETHAAGTAYVYLNYGVHWLFNVLAKGPDMAGFVLFRALEPLSGLGKMAARQGVEDPLRLCSGPGKLTRAFGIGREDHGAAFLAGPGTGIFHGESAGIVEGVRIGISRARELPWRFHEKENSHVSR